MAHIDDLVRRVADPQLREALAAQVRTLTDRKEFGLVFQQHLPETVRLPHQRVRKGDLVERRDSGDGSTQYRVIDAKASEGWAAIMKIDSSGEGVGEVEHLLKADLVVVKPFGDPVYPGLRRVSEAGDAAPAQPTHVVISSENFHALQALQYTHTGKVDLIYIDPPYNTGAADWKYNDRYVDGNDAYRHSKWLSFMERRLRVAHRLLTSTGVIVMAIDDNEHHRARMLLDQTFGESNFLAEIVWQGITKSNSRFGGGGLDYMLVYGRNRDALVASDVFWREPKRGFEDVLQAAEQAWTESGHDPEQATKLYRRWFRETKPDVDAGTKGFDSIDENGRLYQKVSMANPAWRPNLQFEVLHPVTQRPVKMPYNGWQFGPEVMADRIRDGLIVFGPDETTTPRRKSFLEGLSSQEPKMVFERSRSAASKHLLDIFGDKRFPFPKDHEVLMRWFKMLAPKDAVILDFFAGSGTTAEAVIRLNAEDGGTRQCILVTNNELSKAEDAKLRKQGYRPGDEEYEALGVFHHVAVPRLSAILTGLRDDGSAYGDSIPGQKATFFDLTYEDENLVALGRRFEAIAPLLWMQAGARGEVIEKITDWGYDSPAGANYAVIFDPDKSAAAIAALHEGIERVFIVSDSEAAFRGVVADLPGRLQGAAHRLYSNYLRSFAINRAS